MTYSFRFPIVSVVFAVTVLLACKAHVLGSKTAGIVAPLPSSCSAAVGPDIPPADTPYIALGIFQYLFPIRENLSAFIGKIQLELHHPVVEIRQFDRIRNGYGGVGDESYLSQVEHAMNIAIDRSHGRNKVVLFNLDGFDSKRFFPNWPPRYDDAYTAREAHLILCNPCYRDRTRWYRDMRELSAEDLDREFGQWFPRICDRGPF